MKFYASIRIDIRKAGQIKDGEDVIGQSAKVKIVKNKIAPPFRETELKLIYANAGFDNVADLLGLAVKHSIVTKGGAWFTYGTQKWQGEQNAIAALRADATLLEEIKTKLSTFFNPETAGEIPL